MSQFQRKQHESVAIAHVTSSSEADLLRLTLVANGFEAVVSASSYIPSVDFVQGLQVSVRAEDAEAARKLLKKLNLPSSTLD
jgi:hypothetical protein